MNRFYKHVWSSSAYTFGRGAFNHTAIVFELNSQHDVVEMTENAKKTDQHESKAPYLIQKILYKSSLVGFCINVAIFTDL